MTNDTSRQPPASRLEVGSWALYDFANSAFTTLIVTFIFANFFVRKVAPNPETGTILWTRAVILSAVLVALITPILGAAADAGGRKKTYLMVVTFGCVAATAALFTASGGSGLGERWVCS